MVSRGQLGYLGWGNVLFDLFRFALPKTLRDMQLTSGTTLVRIIGESRLISYVANVRPIPVLAALAALVLLWRLGQGSLSDWDEAVYAQAAKEMLQGGDWLVLHYQYKIWMDEPPLLVWLTAIFFQLFGINEFWSRAASAFSGIALVVLTYLTGELVYNKRIGFFAAIILLTSFHFTKYSRAGMTDIVLTLFTLLAIYAFLRLEKGIQTWWYVIGISSGLAILVKSFSGLIAPAVIILELCLTRRFIPTTRSRQFWIGLLMAFVIVAPWHILMLMKYGRMFIDDYILFHIAHATGTLQGNTGNRFFYVDQLQIGFYPWFYLLPFAIAFNIQENLAALSRSCILLLVVVLEFGIYTLAQTKLRWYILPLYPSLAILTAFMVAQAFTTLKSVAFAALVVGTFIVTLVAPRNIALLSVSAGLVFVVVCFLGIRKLSYRPLSGLMCGFLVVVAAYNILPLYRMEEVPVARLARIAASSTPADREPLIVFLGLHRPRALFYSNRPIYEARTREHLAEVTKDPRVRRIIMAKEHILPLSKSFDIHILAEADPLVYALIDPRSERS